MRIAKGIAIGLSSFALAVTLLAAGFGACCLPITTQLLSQAVSDSENSPYTAAQLTTLAQATRDFTVDDYGRATYGDKGAESTLAGAILQAANAASNENSEVYERWSETAKLAVAGANSASEASVAVFEGLAGVSDTYALDTDAISHLQDCNRLIGDVSPYLWVCAAISFLVLAGLHVANMRNPRYANTAALICTIAPCVLIVAFLGFGIWATIDFNGFFSAFHGLFFPQGNWTFSSESLLICMYPLNFWIGMAIVWASTTLICCIACLLLARYLRKKA